MSISVASVKNVRPEETRFHHTVASKATRSDPVPITADGRERSAVFGKKSSNSAADLKPYSYMDRKNHVDYGP